MNGLRFVFWTKKKEPVHKSNFLMKPVARATIMHSLVKVFFAIIFHYVVIAAAEKYHMKHCFQLYFILW